MVRCGHRDDIVVIVTGRIVRVGIGVGTRVARRGDEKDVVGARIGDRQVHGLGESASTPAVAGEVDAHHGGVFDGRQGVGCAAGSAGVQEFQRHDRHVPTHAGHADAVVAHAADGPGTVRPVAIVIHGIVVIVDEIPAVDIVDEAVAVVIDPVVGNFTGVGVDVGRQIGVSVVHARVDHAHDDVMGTGEHVPGDGGVDIRPLGTAGLADVVHPPQIDKAWVIGKLHRFEDIVRFNEIDGGVILVPPDGIAHRKTVELFLIRFDPFEMLDLGGPKVRQDGVLLGLGRVGFEFDYELVGFVGQIDIIGPGGCGWKQEQKNQ